MHLFLGERLLRYVRSTLSQIRLSVCDVCAPDAEGWTFRPIA